MISVQRVLLKAVGVTMVSNIQVFVMLFMAILSTLLILYPPNIAGTSGWIASLLATAYVTFMITIFSLAIKDDNGKNLTNTLNKNIIVKFIANPVIVFFLLTLGAITVADIRALILLYMLPDTPVIVVISTSLILSTIAAKQNLEVIGRISEFTFGIAILFIIGIAVPSVPNIDINSLFPMLEKGIGPPIQASISIADFIGYIFLVMYIIPYINRPQHTPKTLFALLGLIAFILFLQSLYVIGTFGSILSKTMVFPIMELVKYVEIADIISNLEAPLLIMWMPTIIIKISLTIWVTSNIISRTLNLRDEKTIMTPIALLMGAWAMVMFPNTESLIGFSPIFGLWAVTIEYIIPLPILLYVIARNKSKNAKK